MSRAGRIIVVAAEALLLFSAGLIWVARLWIENRFGNVGIDLIALQLTMPLTGLDMRYVVNASLYILLWALISLLFGLAVFRMSGKERVAVLGTRRRTMIFLTVALLLFFGGTVASTENKFHLREFFFPDFTFSTFFEENYVNASSIGPPPGKQANNLILIVAESLENSVNDESLFGEMLMPRLKRLEDGNVHFPGHRESAGTNFTTGGLVSFLCGFPYLFPPDWHLRAQEGGLLFQNAPSTLRVLRDNGYAVEVVMGSYGEYGSKADLVANRFADYALYDRAYFERQYGDLGDDMGAWGPKDSIVFAEARKRLAVLGRGGPFILLVETSNTHLPETLENGMATKWNDSRDVFVQADKLISDFVEWIGRQKFAETTTVAIIGDHEAWGSAIGPVDLLRIKEREIVNIFINPVAGLTPPSRRRLFASWDLAPTILEAMGIELPDGRFGLGTSLFRDTPTLFERMGVDEFSERIGKRSRLYNYFLLGEEDVLARKGNPKLGFPGGKR